MYKQNPKVSATNPIHRDHIPMQLRLMKATDALGGLLWGGHGDEAKESARAFGRGHHLGSNNLNKVGAERE